MPCQGSGHSSCSKPTCQSCAMPMCEVAHFGTNKDGSKSDVYCCHCYTKGAFTDPSRTVDQMIDMVATKMAEMKKMPKERAYAIVKNMVPNLKRWKK